MRSVRLTVGPKAAEVVSCSSELLRVVETWRGDVTVAQRYRGQEEVDGMVGLHHVEMGSVLDVSFDQIH